MNGGSKLAAGGCVLVLLHLLIGVSGALTVFLGAPSAMASKQFVVIDWLPQADGECVEKRTRTETLAHLAQRLGWPVPGGVQGDGYTETVTPPPWPCTLVKAWLDDPIPVGTALEVQKQDAISAFVTGYSGESRQVMLSYHTHGESLDPNPQNDEAPLVGHHTIVVPWNQKANAPACLIPWSAVSSIAWPPRQLQFIYLLAFLIFAFKILDCIGKSSLQPLWTLPLYAILFVPIFSAASLYAESQEQCEPKAATFVQQCESSEGIRPCSESFLQGPWIANSSLVGESQACLALLLLLTLYLIFPAYAGVRYLSAPDSTEPVLRPKPKRSPEPKLPRLAPNGMPLLMGTNASTSWPRVGYVDHRNADREHIEEALSELERIARLPGFAGDAVLSIIPASLIEKRDYRTFWQKAKELGTLFKGSNLHQTDREELWNRFSRLCEQVKALQKGEREDDESRSGRAKGDIMSLLREARRLADSARNFEGLSESRGHLSRAMELMKERFLFKGDRDDCWKEWREVNERVGRRRHDLASFNYSMMRDRISEVSNAVVYGDPYEALRKIKAVQQEIKTADLTKEQRSLLRESLQQWWERVNACLDEHRRNQERKHREWVRRQEEKIDKLETAWAKREAFVQGLLEEINDLESGIGSAWSQSWASRTRTRVQEKYGKIADARRRNKDIENQIRSIKSRLRE